MQPALPFFINACCRGCGRTSCASSWGHMTQNSINLLQPQKCQFSSTLFFLSHFLKFVPAHQPALRIIQQRPTREREGQHACLLKDTWRIFSNRCVTGQSNTPRKVLSALFCIHRLTDTHAWRVVLWLTGESVYAIPPTQKAGQILFSRIPSRMDGCGTAGIRTL